MELLAAVGVLMPALFTICFTLLTRPESGHADACPVHPLLPPGGSGWIISVGDYEDNSFAALGSSEPGEVRLEL